VRSLYDALNRGDIDAVLVHVTDDYRALDVALGRTYEGRQALRQWLETLAAAFSNATAEVKELVADDDWVATIVVNRGAHTGPFASPIGTLPPTGRRFEVESAEFRRLKDGKVSELRLYYDALTFMRQLGLAP
jgi:steroid delta-isomerase-like uncharacterized protein